MNEVEKYVRKHLTVEENQKLDKLLEKITEFKPFIEIGICLYCEKTVDESSAYELSGNVLLHKQCKNDVMADIQDQKGSW